MSFAMDRWKVFNRNISIELPEIAHETESGILIEWNHQNAWLPKDKVTIQKNPHSVTVRLPKWLYHLKF